MITSTKEHEVPQEVREVRIVSGLKPEDVESVLNMAGASGLFSPDAMMAAEDMAWDTAYGDGGENHTFLLAKVDAGGTDLAVGFICYGPIAHWPGEYELYGIAVMPDYQRMGIGSGLVAEMTRRIVGRGGRRIFLETGEDRAFENARCFYEANEFVCERRFHKQFIPLDGGVIYRLDIAAEENDQQYQ